MNLKALAFNGSPHADGNTAMALKIVLAELEAEGIECELLHVGAMNLRGCSACDQCFVRKDGKCAIVSDALNDCVYKMLKADAILLGSPVYVGDVSSSIRALIERACMISRANGNVFMRRIGAGVVVARRAGGTSALDSMNRFLLAQGMAVAGSSYWNLAIGKARWGIMEDAEGLRTMKNLGSNIVWMTKGLRG